ncbi:MAG: hypothetical protein ACKOPT_03830 [Cyanobium sp.]
MNGDDPELLIAEHVRWFTDLDDDDLRERLLVSPTLREPGVAAALIDGVRLLTPVHDPELASRYRRLVTYLSALALLVDGWTESAAA